VCNLSFFWHEWVSLKLEWNESFKGPRVPKKPKLHKNELNTTFFCSTSPPKAPNRWKYLKLAWRFVLTSCQIYQNPFTQEKILKFWQKYEKNAVANDKCVFATCTEFNDLRQLMFDECCEFSCWDICSWWRYLSNNLWKRDFL
jgi:hypothetical protein